MRRRKRPGDRGAWVPVQVNEPQTAEPVRQEKKWELPKDSARKYTILSAEKRQPCIYDCLPAEKPGKRSMLRTCVS